MTEKEKAKNGELYNPMYDKELIQERFNVKDLCFKYNNTLPSNVAERNFILKQIYLLQMKLQLLNNHLCVIMDIIFILEGTFIPIII